jgi:hypothetical protein
MPEEITRRAMPFVDAAPEEACLVLIYGGRELGKRFALDGETTIGRKAGSSWRRTRGRRTKVRDLFAIMPRRWRDRPPFRVNPSGPGFR